MLNGKCFAGPCRLGGSTHAGRILLRLARPILHLLSPETVIEIGVADGASLARVRPPTLAIGVDPKPTVFFPLTAETHIFPETSDAFFARRGPDSLLAGAGRWV